MFLLRKKIYISQKSRGEATGISCFCYRTSGSSRCSAFFYPFFVLYNFLLRAPRRPIQHCGLAISWCAVSSPSQRIFFYNAKSLKVHVVKQLFLLRRPVLQLFVCVWIHFEDAIYLYIIFAKKERGKICQKGVESWSWIFSGSRPPIWNAAWVAELRTAAAVHLRARPRTMVIA